MEPTEKSNAVQSLKWQTMVLHAKEAPSGFKIHKVEERGTFSVKYVSSFRANEAIDWLLANNYATNRDEAVAIGQRMVDEGIIWQVPKKKKCTFKDEKQFYRFVSDKEVKDQKRKNSSTTGVSPLRVTPPESARRSPSSTQAGTPNDSPRVSVTEDRKSSGAEPPLRNSSGSNPLLASAETLGKPDLKPVNSLGGEATREEWLQWLLVSPEAEERLLLIIGYGGWMTPEEFGQLLFTVFPAMKARCSARELESLEKRALEVLDEWMQSTQDQKLLSVPLADKLKKFFVAEFSSLSALKALRSLSAIQTKEQTQILSQIQQGVAADPQGRIRSLLTNSALQQALEVLGAQPSLLIRDEISAREIVETLTMNQHIIFTQLQPTELFHNAWQKPDKVRKAPTVVALTDQFNFTAHWVMEEVVTASESEARITIIEKAVKIAQLALDMRNFLLAVAVLAGLGGHLTVRARKAIDLPHGSQKTLEHLLQLTDPAGYYKNLMTKTMEMCPVGSKHPAVPFIAPYLTTILQQEELSPHWIDKKINVAKMRSLSSKIQALLRFRSPAYNLTISTRVAAYFGAFRPQPEEQLARMLVQIVA